MANQDVQPVLSVQPVNSGQEGYEAFGKALGGLAEEAGNVAIKIAGDESNAMYVNSVANVEQLKKNSQASMLENLGNAPKIAEQTSAAMDQVVKNAYVNKKDRSRLQAYATNAQGDLELNATKINVQQAQRSAALTHFSNFPDQLQAYHEALKTDHDKAEQLHNSMVSSIRSLVSLGAITPEQGGSSMRLMQDTVDSANNYYDLVNSTNASAQDYHTVNSSPLNRQDMVSNAPINESTAWLVDHYTGDRSLQGVKADISNRVLPNFDVFTSLKPHEQEDAKQYMAGIQMADGMIHSGMPFNQIQKVYDEMSQKGTELSPRDASKRAALGKYIEELKSGNYLSVIAHTPYGNNMMYDFNSRNTAITNLAVDDKTKSQLLFENKNRLVDQAVAYGQATHKPEQYIQPIPQQDVAVLESGLQKNGDPNAVLKIVNSYSKNNRVYVAQALKDPLQRMVVSAVSLSDQNISVHQQIDFLAANRSGEQYLKETDNAALLNRIASNLKDPLSVVSKVYNPEDQHALSNAMLISTLKYARYLAVKDGHIDSAPAADMKKYVDQACTIYNNSYRKMSGTNWVANAQQLPQPMTSGQMDVLADHVVSEGYERLKKSSRSQAEYESAIGRNPLIMVVSSNNSLLAVDGYGKVYYEMPFTNNTLPYAKESKKLRETEKKKILLKSYEQSAMQSTGMMEQNVNAQ